MNEEQRIAKRISFTTSASIYYGTNDVAEAALETRDLSLAGVFLATNAQIPQGTSCSLEIKLTGKSSKMRFVVEGTVCRNEMHGIAVNFTKLTPDGYAHIRNLMNIQALENS